MRASTCPSNKVAMSSTWYWEGSFPYTGDSWSLHLTRMCANLSPPIRRTMTWIAHQECRRGSEFQARGDRRHGDHEIDVRTSPTHSFLARKSFEPCGSLRRRNPGGGRKRDQKIGMERPPIPAASKKSRKKRNTRGRRSRFHLYLPQSLRTPTSFFVGIWLIRLRQRRQKGVHANPVETFFSKRVAIPQIPLKRSQVLITRVGMSSKSFQKRKETRALPAKEVTGISSRVASRVG
mmetsp:Transcript_1908/g.8449  ORF Transcript_1908/g.8449 Transcript_1908/m.8449 type:complete len:235 (+) Transcript_1908:1656-2360(+)